MPSLAGNNPLTEAPSLAANYRMYVVNPTGPVDYYATLEDVLELATGVDNTAYIRTDGTRAFTGDQSMGSNKLTNVADPTAANDAANKSYVDAAGSGFNVLTAAAAASTAAATLASDFENGDTLDGVTLSTGDVILIKDQASGTENGLYVVQASGAPSRHADLPAAASASGAYVFVQNGTTNSGTAWVCTNASGSDVVDTDALVFAQVAGAPGGGAPASASYVVLSANTTLTDERILVTSEGVTRSDAGAGNNVTFKLDVDGLTEDTAPDTAADFIPTYDTSAGTHKKVKPNNLGLGAPFSDDTALVKGSADATKLIAFDADTNITTGTTRTITMPDQNVDLTPGSGTFFDASGNIGDLNDVTITSLQDDQVLRANGGVIVNSTFDAAWIGTGTVAHERGGLEFDASAVAIGDVVAGTGTGTMGLVTATGHSDGDVLTLQADGTADWEAIPGGGTQWTDTGTLLHPADLSGAEDVAIGQTTANDSARLTVTKDGLPASIECATDAASNQFAIFKGNDRATPGDGDEAYITFQLEDDQPALAEFARMTWEANDVTNTTKDGEFRFAVMVDDTLTNQLTINENGVTITDLTVTGTLTDKADFEVMWPPKISQGGGSSSATIGGGSSPAEELDSWNFDNSSEGVLDFKVMMTRYGGGGLKVRLPWTSSETTGNVVWQVAIRRMQSDTDAFATSHTYQFNTVTDAAPSAAGELLYAEVTFSDGADMDNWADDEFAIVRIKRDPSHGSDDLAGNAELLGMQISEA